MTSTNLSPMPSTATEHFPIGAKGGLREVSANSFPTKNNLDADVREKAIALPNQHLADTMDLYGQTKQAHWNVKGMQFFQLHKLLVPGS